MGAVANGAAVTSGYWDRSSTGTNQANSAGGAGAVAKSASELQNPVCYTGDYVNWNVDLDGDGAADQP